MATKEGAKKEMKANIDAVTLERHGRLFNRGDLSIIARNANVTRPTVDSCIKSGYGPISICKALKAFYEEKEKEVTELNTPSI